MQRVFFLVTAIILIWQCQAFAQSFDYEKDVISSGRKARVVDLTAHMRIKNVGTSDVENGIFRLTMPPNLVSQTCKLLVADVEPANQRFHKNGANEYLEFQFPVAAGKEVVKNVTFRILLKPVDFLQSKSIDFEQESAEDLFEQYKQPSKLIESDSNEVIAASNQVFDGIAKDELETAKAAYEAPTKLIKFKLQKKQLGAKQVLKTGVGDCTEFACLFAALCRTQDIPARKVGVFNFAKNKKISLKQPNHHIAEVYLPTHGWIPVDPNLGRGKYNRKIGFGKLDNTIVILNREGAWVWSKAHDKSKPKPKFEYGISWDGNVVEEGKLADIREKFFPIE
jgi:hypothetical protein